MPTAMNRVIPPTANVTAGPGPTAIDASAPGVTVTDAFAEMRPTDATTVFANHPAVVPAENIPVELIVPPPAAMVHVGDTGTLRPSASYPRAVICCVDPAVNVTFAEMVRLTTVPGAKTPCTSHATANTPANAPAIRIRV
jgi:hypothetical protein